MRFSLWPFNQRRFAELLDNCRHAEATGWDGVWIPDHLMPSRPPLDLPVVECWTTAAAIAVAVPRVRIGTLVASNTFRHPAVVAKMAASLDDISGGRFVLGIGAGWQPNEHAATGIDFPPPRVRLAQLDEACRVIRALLDEPEVSFEGDHYRLEGAVFAPRPARRLPLLVGVKGDRGLEVAARHADEWNLWATPDHIRERGKLLDTHCEAIGRDPAEIGRSAQALLLMDRPGADRSRWEASGLPMITGSVDEVREVVAAYAEAGVDELVVPDFALGRDGREETLDTFIGEVAAGFR